MLFEVRSVYLMHGGFQKIIVVSHFLEEWRDDVNEEIDSIKHCHLFSTRVLLYQHCLPFDATFTYQHHHQSSAPTVLSICMIAHHRSSLTAIASLCSLALEDFIPHQDIHTSQYQFPRTYRVSAQSLKPPHP